MSVLQIQWGRRRNQILLYLLFLVIGAVLGGVVETILYTQDGGVKHAAPVGFIFAMFFLGIAHIIAATLYFTVEFELAISMGITRKRFIRNYLSFAAIEMAAYYVILFLLYQFEVVLWKNTLGLSMAEEVLGLLDELYVYTAVGMIALVAVECLMGALLLRLGPKIMVAIWILLMIPSVITHMGLELPVITLQGAGIGAVIADAGKFGIAGMILTVAVVIYLVAWKLLKRQQIA